MDYNDDFHFPPDIEIINGEQFIHIDFPYRALRLRREELNMTQEQVAAAAKMKPERYRKIECDDFAIDRQPLRAALAICDALRLDPHRFV